MKYKYGQIIRVIHINGYFEGYDASKDFLYDNKFDDLYILKSLHDKIISKKIKLKK